MDTRWKRFRYGTEERNPSWSFWGAVLCPGFMLILLAYAYWRGSGFWLMTGSWFLVFSAFSWVHLSRLMKNEKKNLFPVRLLDRTCPDLILAAVLLVVGSYLMTEGWSGNTGWWSYSHMAGQALYYFSNPVLFLWYFFSSFFITETIVLFVVVLYMSVVRHMTREKLRKKLFFVHMKEYAQKKVTKWRRKWEKYQIACMEKGEAAKIFRRRQLWPLCIRNLAFLLVCLYLGAVYYAMEDIMFLFILLGAVFFLADLLFLLKTTREVGILLDEICQIAEDRQEWEEPQLKPTSLLGRAEEGLLSIQKNKKESMEKRLQSERMKVDLITNVSHDLKTPLTSMIGCIDLLKQVEELPQEAKDYVSLLSAKAERLRGMIQDVFDMAKATSGGQDLKMERLDMTRLIRQTMADMQDRIDGSGLRYRMKVEDRELPFQGDSKKMYRVYQNLIENTLKYSMAGSRVYVEVTERDGKILTSVKNTSDCEMDFSAEEIMERFTRGDKSRSTEGNGLGLAIARSFTEACGGSFQVTLDGDLFRADTEFLMLQE